MANSIVVIGSLNMDFVLAVERLPLPGETILGRNFRTIPGGKGANQAYAAALTSAAVDFSNAYRCCLVINRLRREFRAKSTFQGIRRCG